MTTPKRTRHACPICQEIVWNDAQIFHQHLTSSCAPDLFQKYPGLKSCSFNALWYKLDGMVKDQLIIPSGINSVPAIIHLSNRTPPGFPHRPQPQFHHQTHYQPQPQRQEPQRMDLEDIDRKIGMLERDRIRDRKRRRMELTNEANAEIAKDEFTLSMPSFDDNLQSKKRRILYHNTSDIRPPKRVNLDASINLKLFQHKVREQRRKYHNVSFYDFANGGNVDHHSAVIHAQKALDRYLRHCALLRKCFDAKLFVKMSKKYEEIFGVNYKNVMIAMLKEIEFWQKFENEDDDLDDLVQGKKEKDEKKEEFLSCWDAIPQQTELHHLDKLLERENLCGFWSKIDEGLEDGKHLFDNSKDCVKCGGFSESIFEEVHNKTYIKL